MGPQVRRAFSLCILVAARGSLTAAHAGRGASSGITTIMRQVRARTHARVRPCVDAEILTRGAVNDVCIHPNQGELVSCDQVGSIKQWDLSENVCMLEMVRRFAKLSLEMTPEDERFLWVALCAVDAGSCWRRSYTFRIYCFRRVVSGGG